MANAAAANDTQDRLPVFYAEKENDTISAEDWVNRAVALQQAAAWPPVKAVNECRLALRGMASEWYMSLQLDQAHLYTNFEQFIEAFKKFTEVAEKPEDLIAQTADLKQKPNERVTIFYVRCRRVVMRHLQAATMDAIPDELKREELDNAVEGTRQRIEDLQTATFKQAFFHVLLTWFLAGLKPEIRGRLLDKRCLNHTEAHEEAVAIEMAIESQKGVVNKPPAVFAVQQSNAAGQQTNDGAVEVDYVQRGGRRGRQQRGGRGQSRGHRGGRGQNHNQANGTSDANKKGPVPYQKGQRIPADVCAYCRKRGHWQKECHKRRRENGRLIRIFAVNASEDQFGDPPADKMEQRQEEARANLVSAEAVGSYLNRGPPPGYPFPDAQVQAQQAMMPFGFQNPWQPGQPEN